MANRAAVRALANYRPTSRNGRLEVLQVLIGDSHVASFSSNRKSPIRLSKRQILTNWLEKGGEKSG
jgi:hypothetical protein